MKVGAPEKLITDGKRIDGRKLDEFRKIKTEARVLDNAIGSGMFSFGNTKALSSVYGPKPFFPRGLQDPTKSIITCKYNMAPFSTTERIRPGIHRRSVEISKVIGEALSNVIFSEDYPKTGISIFIEIIQADASTRCAGLNAACIALADSGVPMRDMVSCCSVGKVDGELVLDVGRLEDNYGDVDLAIATVGGTDKVVLLQMDGIVTKEELFKLLDMGVKGCAVVCDEQRQALRKKYSTGETNER